MSQPRFGLTDRQREGRRIELIDKLATDKQALLRERNEAREAAREILALLQQSAVDHDHDAQLFERWPWLQTADDES